MYTVKVRDEFSSAHNLREYKGKCENLHGHNWKVDVEASSEELNGQGMLIDFREIKNHLAKVVEELDHKYLNDIPFFKKNNPTSEIIAKYIFDKLKENLKNISKVTVWESDSSCASYKP